MPRTRYTSKVAWTATTEQDFIAIKEAQDGIARKGFDRPTERDMMRVVMGHYLSNINSDELRDAYIAAIKDVVKAEAAKKAAAEKAKKAARLAEIEAEAERLRNELG